MLYRDTCGCVIDTSRKPVICVFCGNDVLKEDIIIGKYYYDYTTNPITGDNYGELLHEICGEKLVKRRVEELEYAKFNLA